MFKDITSIPIDAGTACFINNLLIFSVPNSPASFVIIFLKCKDATLITNCVIDTSIIVMDALKFYKFVENRPMSETFQLKRIVNIADIDDLNHVNNAVYVKWMDEIAHQHWVALTSNSPLLDYIWVVLRHEIDYVGQAVLNDLVISKTWIGDTKGFKSERHFEFSTNEKVLVKAKTIYGMLDAKTYKPTRIRENVLKVLEPFK